MLDESPLFCRWLGWVITLGDRNLVLGRNLRVGPTGRHRRIESRERGPQIIGLRGGLSEREGKPSE